MSDFEGKDWFGEEQPPPRLPDYPPGVSPPPRPNPPYPGHPPYEPMATGYAPNDGYGFPPPQRNNQAAAWWTVGVIAALVVLIGVWVIGAASDESGPNEEAATPTTIGEREVAQTTTSPPTTTTTSPPTTPAPPPPTDPPPPGFDNGMWIVGQDIQPGRYMSAGGFTCYWERNNGTGGTLDDVIVNGNASGQVVMDIEASDTAFTSEGCARWVVYAPPPAPATTFDDGDWVVGEQIQPGTYRVEDPSGLCSWERARDFTHEIDGSSDIDVTVAAGDTVQLRAGERFTSDMCGTWVSG